MEPDVLLGLRKACDANAYDGCVTTLDGLLMGAISALNSVQELQVQTVTL